MLYTTRLEWPDEDGSFIPPYSPIYREIQQKKIATQCEILKVVEQLEAFVASVSSEASLDGEFKE